MIHYITEIIPRIQRSSKRIDNKSLLVDKYWIRVDENSSNDNRFFFEGNNELLIIENGIPVQYNWRYLDNNSLFIEPKEGHGFILEQVFFDKNILIFTHSVNNEFIVLINKESLKKYALQTLEKVFSFLSNEYLESDSVIKINDMEWYSFETDKGIVYIERSNSYSNPEIGKKAKIEGDFAPSGKFKFGILKYVTIENGIIVKITKS